MPDAALEPALGQAQRLFGVAVVGVAGAAFIERHDDVGADDPLRIDVVFRRENVPGAVDVRLEDAALFGEFPALGEREDLEAAAVGQDGPVPRGEGVEAAGPAQDVEAGAQVEMVCVAQDDLGLDVFFEFFMENALHGADGPHRHEDGGFNRTVVGGDPAEPGAGRAVL